VRGEETHALLFAYLDQELEVVSHMEMADHLATYPQCTRAYTAQQAMQSALRTAPAL
jgi:anti-sigma factor RsiW